MRSKSSAAEQNHLPPVFDELIEGSLAFEKLWESGSEDLFVHAFSCHPLKDMIESFCKYTFQLERADDRTGLPCGSFRLRHFL